MRFVCKLVEFARPLPCSQDGRTPVMLASGYRHYGLVTFLADAGADVGIEDKVVSHCSLSIRFIAIIGICASYSEKTQS